MTKLDKWKEVEDFYWEAVRDYESLEPLGKVGLVDPKRMREEFVRQHGYSVENRAGDPSRVLKSMKTDARFMSWVAEAQAKKAVIINFMKDHRRTCTAEFAYFPQEGYCRLDRRDEEVGLPTSSVKVDCPKVKWEEVSPADELEAGSKAMLEMGRKGWLDDCALINRKTDMATAAVYVPDKDKVTVADVMDYGDEADKWTEEMRRKYG